MGLPGPHLSLHPTCPGAHPWGLFLCYPQARKVHSEHRQRLFLMRPHVTVITMTMMRAANVPGTLQLVIPINANLCQREHNEVHVEKF